MIEGSFEFNGLNSADNFGMYVRQKTLLAPNKRINKKIIPNKNGAYRHKTRSWDETIITLDLFCANDIDRHNFRQISAWLSQPGKLRFWDEEDKYYEGEIEKFPTFDEYSLLRMQEMKVDFVAFPFAIGTEKTISLHSGDNIILYDGTAPMPPIITLKNNTISPITNLKIILTYEE